MIINSQTFECFTEIEWQFSCKRTLTEYVWSVWHQNRKMALWVVIWFPRIQVVSSSPPNNCTYFVQLLNFRILIRWLNLRMKYILDGQHAFTQNASSKHVFSQHASFQHTSTQHAYPSDKSVLGSQEWFLANYLLKYSSGKVTSWSCKCSILLGLNFVEIKNSFTKMYLFFKS